MEWFNRWRRYEAKVWRNAWEKTEVAAKKAVSTGLGIGVSVTLGALLLGAAVELRSFLPLGAAAVLFLATLWVNLFLAPSRLDEVAEETLAGAKRETEALKGRLGQKQIQREQYEALKPLLEEGEALVIRGGMPTWDDWASRVVVWRTRVYEGLPFERDGFLGIASPQMFEVARGEQRRLLVVGQLEKFRKIMMRLENEVDDWQPGRR